MIRPRRLFIPVWLLIHTYLLSNVTRRVKWYYCNAWVELVHFAIAVAYHGVIALRNVAMKFLSVHVLYVDTTWSHLHVTGPKTNLCYFMNKRTKLTELDPGAWYMKYRFVPLQWCLMDMARDNLSNSAWPLPSSDPLRISWRSINQFDAVTCGCNIISIQSDEWIHVEYIQINTHFNGSKATEVR